MHVISQHVLYLQPAPRSAVFICSQFEHYVVNPCYNSSEIGSVFHHLFSEFMETRSTVVT